MTFLHGEKKTFEKKIKEIFRKNSKLLLPPEINEIQNVEGIEVLEENGEIIAFYKSFSYNSSFKEVEFVYSKPQSMKGNLFILEKMLEDINEKEKVIVTTWKHNSISTKASEKLGELIEKGYVWTVFNPDITLNKNLKPFVEPINEENEEYLVFNGSYLSMYFSIVDYNFIYSAMEAYKVPYFVVYHQFPDLKYRFYEYRVFRLIKEKVEKYRDIYRKKLKN